MNRTVGIVLASIVVFAILGMVIMAIAFNLSTGASRLSAPTPPPEVTATVGDMTYDIADLGVRKRFASGIAVGQYIVLDITVSNISSSTATVDNGDFRLVNQDDRSFDPVDFPFDGAFSHADVGPGQRIRGTLVFDIPADTAATDYSIKLWGNGDDVSREISVP